MKTRRLGLACLVLVLLLDAVPIQAQDGDYDLDWWTADGGGVTGQNRATVIL